MDDAHRDHCGGGLDCRWSLAGYTREKFNLPEHIQIVTYFSVGFPIQTPLLPDRMTVQEAVLVLE